jgi:cytochrome P450
MTAEFDAAVQGIPGAPSLRGEAGMHYLESPKNMPFGPLPDPFDVAKLLPGILWATAPNGTGFWLVTDYRLARKVLTDRRLRRSEAAGLKAPKIAAYNPAPSAIISLDGADHVRMRNLIGPAFTESRIAELEPFATQLTEGLLDGLEAQRAPADFVSHVSAQLPFRVLCHILGVPEDDRDVFGSWVNVLFRLNHNGSEGRQHSVSLVRYMMQLIASKRQEPGADLISELIRSAEQKSNVTDRELVTLCLSLLMAGYDSTVDQITLCVLMLMLTPSLMKKLSSNPELVPGVTEEMLRLNPAPYMTFPRMAVAPVSIGGITIQPGQLVVAFLMSSNRDPSAFAVPEEIAPERTDPSHLTFGLGVHRCLGAPLARLQLTTLIAALVRRFPELRPAGDMNSLHWKTGMATRGLSEMYVSW